MGNRDLSGYFSKIEGVDYNHREGGRYAYVQLMAYLRDLRLVLVEDGMSDSIFILELDHTSDLLNELVSLRFEESHRVVFEERRNLLLEMKEKLFAEEVKAA